MLVENVCKFVPHESVDDKIRTIHFVAETKHQSKENMRLNAFFTVAFVLSGTGVLHTRQEEIPLRENTLFFTFPSEKYSIESGEGFSYLYLSYIGLRSNRYNQRLNITPNHCVFHELEEVRNTLTYFFDISESVNLGSISESAVLYLYAVLEKNMAIAETDSTSDLAVMKIKKYINDHFSDPNLSLDQISRELAYHKNYISTMFKKKTKVTLTNYINTIRIQKACTLMKQNLTCVKDISNLCGIEDSLYFSKLFKKQMGIPPKQFISLYSEKK